jgi:hypothetical protein
MLHGCNSRFLHYKTKANKVQLNKKCQPYFKQEVISIEKAFSSLYDSTFCADSNFGYWNQLLESMNNGREYQLSMQYVIPFLLAPFVEGFYFDSKSNYPLDSSNYLLRYDLRLLMKYYNFKDSTFYLEKYHKHLEHNDSLKIAYLESLFCEPIIEYYNFNKPEFRKEGYDDFFSNYCAGINTYIDSFNKTFKIRLELIRLNKN